MSIRSINRNSAYIYARRIDAYISRFAGEMDYARVSWCEHAAHGSAVQSWRLAAWSHALQLSALAFDGSTVTIVVVKSTSSHWIVWRTLQRNRPHSVRAQKYG